MKDFAEYWWLLAIRGVLLIILGIMALVYPISTVAVLVMFVGVYALVEGVMTLILGFVNINKDANWWMYVLEGFLGILLGIFVLKWSALSLFLFVYVVGIWILIAGVLRIVASFDKNARKERKSWLLAVAGIVGVALGILLLTNPLSGLVAIPILLGIYGLAIGVLFIVLSLQLRSAR